MPKDIPQRSDSKGRFLETDELISKLLKLAPTEMTEILDGVKENNHFCA